MDKIYESYVENSMGGAMQHVPKFAQFIYNYKRFFPADLNLPVLDIGVGRGEMLSSMRDWGYKNYYGIDISASTIAYCNKLGLQCELVANTEQWLLDKSGVYSAITLLDVLEHIPKQNVISFLVAVSKALAPGGVLIIQTPNLQAYESYLHRYNDFTHEVGFVEHSLEQVLLAAGFAKASIHMVGFEVFVQNTPLYVLMRLMRAIFWRIIWCGRMLTANLHPRIMHPVFFAVAKKQ